VGYCGDSKRHIPGRKQAFWRIDHFDRSRNATWARLNKAKKEEKERKEKKET